MVKIQTTHNGSKELVNESAFPSSNVSKFDVQDTSLDGLLEKNKVWAAKVLAEDPTFFSTIAEKQQPKILWIGKSCLLYNAGIIHI